ncbi:hypothetical protein RRG08_033209 [Elysia crispata]|uniref:Uncharacterized protein n=1 Tax=Elysia crispata TaxID=231223 RepID=A0AAE1BAI9_9GAST|nr:hypothetical protein RRG08_033209 [Elysia crispata]
MKNHTKEWFFFVWSENASSGSELLFPRYAATAVKYGTRTLIKAAVEVKKKSGIALVKPAVQQRGEVFLLINEISSAIDRSGKLYPDESQFTEDHRNDQRRVRENK